MTETDLTLTEQHRLNDLEQEIESLDRNIRVSLFEIGGLLQEIRDQKLYRQNYGTFEQYLKNRWGYTRDMGYKLILAHEIRATLPEAEREMITSMRQATALASADEADRPEILRLVQTTGKLTAKSITHEIERRENKPLVLKPRIYGNPMNFRGLRNEPINENGVVFLFGLIANDLGFSVESVQAGFPDCDAKQQIGSNKWRHVRIEFEYESKNFFIHGHDPNGCDIIVCWKHNWKDCPQNLEVIELSSRIESL